MRVCALSTFSRECANGIVGREPDYLGVHERNCGKEIRRRISYCDGLESSR